MPYSDWTSVKPFAGPKKPLTCVCHDCGATWRRGMSGSHSCADHLKAHARELAHLAEAWKRTAETCSGRAAFLMGERERIQRDLGAMAGSAVRGLLAESYVRSEMARILHVALPANKPQSPG